MAKTKTFESIVREQPSVLGKYGKITSKELAGFIGKRVKVTIQECKD